MTRPSQLLLVALAVAGCHRREIPSGPGHDVQVDTGLDAADAPDGAGDPDVWVDAPSDVPDGDDDGAPEPACPPEGPVGAPCAGDGDCPAGLSCLEEGSQTYEAETYVDWRGGYCVDASFVAGCDPDDPSACPAGSRCVHLGLARCSGTFACMDACAPADPGGVPYGFNACCREGYRCDPGLGVCVPGCSNDRECCEAWHDADGDALRGEGEVLLASGCGLSCSPDTYGCTGPGAGTYASACTFDSDCPEGATCLPEWCPAPFGGPFEGGLCVRERCDLVGVDCAPGAGACVQMGGPGDPLPACMAACVTAATGACRDGYACRPACAGDWVGPAPAGGEDGFCWPANGSSAPPETLYEECTSDAACHSPLGLGICLAVAGQARCSVRCNDSLARASGVCGGAASPGGLPAGACWQCACRRVCDDPSAPLGDDACAASGRLACYDASALFGEISWATGAAPPPGLCLPACSGPDDCTALWGMPLACDTERGTCAL